MHQICRTVDGVQNPEGVALHSVKPILLTKEFDLRRKLAQLLPQEILDVGIHLGHIIRQALYLHMARHIPVFHKLSVSRTSCSLH